MKKTILSLAAALLVATNAQAAQPAYLMTREQMLDIYRQSFDRMNTTMEISLTTLDELPAWEEEYTRRTGLARKEDLMLSSLPMEGDMPFEDALQLARTILQEKFGVSGEALDAMGMYPRLMDYVYTDQESEWEFYFTPLRDTDVLLDHDLPDGGEFSVTLGAQTGTVIDALWYSDRLPDQDLVSLARAAALADSGMDEQAFDAFFAPGYVHHFNYGDGTCLTLLYARTADEPDGDNTVYQVVQDVQTGRILRMERTNGVG